MDTQAVPASGSIFETYQKLTERPVIKQETTRQAKIASLANSDSFKALQEAINQFIFNLEEIPINPKEDTPESVGFRYLASKVAIEYLKEVKNLPQRYKELLEGSNN
jgi:hypothetical protein